MSLLIPFAIFEDSSNQIDKVLRDPIFSKLELIPFGIIEGFAVVYEVQISCEIEFICLLDDLPDI